jgi:hypothetical protein
VAKIDVRKARTLAIIRHLRMVLSRPSIGHSWSTSGKY